MDLVRRKTEHAPSIYIIILCFLPCFLLFLVMVRVKCFDPSVFATRLPGTALIDPRKKVDPELSIQLSNTKRKVKNLFAAVFATIFFEFNI
jgi:hypothetical protein